MEEAMSDSGGGAGGQPRVVQSRFGSLRATGSRRVSPRLPRSSTASPGRDRGPHRPRAERRSSNDGGMQCVLRDVRDEDLSVLFEQWADPVAANMAAFTAVDHMDRDAFERRWSRLRADETIINRAIVVDGDLVGTIGSWGDPGDRELTYWIGRAYWGRGIATAALGAFLSIDRSRPMHARVAADNVASRRVLEKCGFRVVATDRGYAEARSAEIDELVLQLAAA